MCSSRTPSSFARTAVVLSFVLASSLAAAQPAADSAGSPPPPPSGKQSTYANEKERIEALDERYGDAYTDSKGIGMRKAGVILTAIGGAALGVGIPSLAIGAATADSGDTSSAILLGSANYLVIPGIIALSVGIPMLVKGGRRRARYYEWLDEQDSRARMSRRAVRMKPLVAAGRSGWSLGFRVNF